MASGNDSRPQIGDAVHRLEALGGETPKQRIRLDTTQPSGPSSMEPGFPQWRFEEWTPVGISTREPVDEFVIRNRFLDAHCHPIPHHAEDDPRVRMRPATAVQFRSALAS